MIEITLLYQRNLLVGIESKGHSGYADRGSDVVCAAVSVLMEALMYGLSQIAKLDSLVCRINDNIPLMSVRWFRTKSEKISLLTQTVAESLKAIAADNSSYVKIHTEEIKL